MKTIIFTKPNIKNFDSKVKLIFNDNINFQLRADDLIQVLDGFCVERIDRVYYSIPNNSQEVHLITEDSGNEYPEVSR